MAEKEHIQQSAGGCVQLAERVATAVACPHSLELARPTSREARYPFSNLLDCQYKKAFGGLGEKMGGRIARCAVQDELCLCMCSCFLCGWSLVE
jgi:hypothetical protein